MVCRSLNSVDAMMVLLVYWMRGVYVDFVVFRSSGMMWCRKNGVDLFVLGLCGFRSDELICFDGK